MAAIFDSADPSSPSAYNASQTALLLLDFQNFILDRCGSEGSAALAKAKEMLDWAVTNKVMIIHGLVDATGKPLPTRKGVERLTKMMAEVVKDPRNSEEPKELASAGRQREFVLWKNPGIAISNLKSKGAVDLLTQHEIKSLIMCGISTSGCILRTSIPAADDGFIVSIIQDACCDPTEGVHDMLVKSVLPSKAHVATADEFIKAWSGA